MSKLQRNIERLRSKPVPADFKWTELVTVLAHFGYQLKPNSGSHRKFIHPVTKAIISLHAPHPSPDVDKGALNDVAEHLRQRNLI